VSSSTSVQVSKLFKYRRKFLEIRLAKWFVHRGFFDRVADPVPLPSDPDFELSVKMSVKPCF
jgi:hypothetical protein